MSRPRIRSRGFSLVELMVVLSIIAILLSLTLGVVQEAREAARAMRCSDQLRQIGLGLSLHHDAHGVFPTNGGWDGRQTILSTSGQPVEVFTRTNADSVVYHWGAPDPSLSPDKQTGGWAYAILPYIEQTSLYNAVNYQHAVALYACPSRRPATVQYPADDDMASYSGGGWSWGKIDYAVNGQLIRNRPVSVHPADPESDSRQNTRRGLARMGSITDGTSNTILAGEKAMDLARATAGGWFWDEPFLLGGSYATARRGIDVLPDRFGIAYRDNWGSAHQSLAHFLFADGSVRRVEHGAPPWVMRAWLSPSGGEPGSTR
jgi:prepilin-type N-terminal cleavage/methylation domain-containing protein/prepilin-type processing-associated H-X9-DG protein